MCQTGKLTYSTMRDAVKAADEVNRKLRDRSKRGSRYANFTHAFRCQFCSGYHTGRAKMPGHKRPPPPIEPVDDLDS